LQAAGVSVLFSSVIFLDPVSFSVGLFSLTQIVFYSSLFSSVPVRSGVISLPIGVQLLPVLR
jgi:hypothetical protein